MVSDSKIARKLNRYQSDCVDFNHDVIKILILLGELTSEIVSKMEKTRNRRENIIALKFAKSVISSHLVSVSEIHEHLSILQETFGNFKSYKCLLIECALYKEQIREFKPIYRIYSKMFKK
jgi:hypothetical protein